MGSGIKWSARGRSGPQRLGLLGVVVTAAVVSFTYYGLTLTQTTTDLFEENALKEERPVIAKRRHNQVVRHRALRRICTRWNVRSLVTITSLDHIIVDDHHKLLYCYVPKVACTNWKRVMLVLSRNISRQPLDIPANASHGANMLRLLSSYTMTEAQSKLERYFKFLIVRHPFERLVSAFRNKFEKNYSTYFQNRFGRTIIQRFRLHPTNESLARGHDVTFDEFVDYILDPETRRSESLNEHWRPINELCSPCWIDYDVIGKYETLQDDAQYILNAANVSHLVNFPKIAKTENTSHIMKHYLDMLPYSKLRNLYNMFALDFRLFNYEYTSSR